jgi:DNA topoisomerase-1
MTKTLVVVESPAKAKTINKFLGSSYVVKACYGHVRDLPKNELGVDIEKDFSPTYVALKEASKPVKELKESAKKVDQILLASDPDREGEAIGWHVAELLKSCNKPIQRIVFNAITKRSLLEAAKNPRAIDENLVNAQQARRILDRLVGYKISPLLQFGIRKGLSAGRVQSVAVRMVCEREAEIRAFVIEEYWTLDAMLATERGDLITARLFRIGDEKPRITNEASALEIVRDLEGASYSVSGIERKDVRRNPYPPFITSSLQQEASRKLGFSPRKTMMIAQALYEGVTLGEEGATGVITYMRTDSTRIDGEAISDVREYIKANFEPAMLPEKPNVYTGRKGAQDAHEAIRPTSTARTPESIRGYLNDDQFKLYQVIWRRFVSSQMSPAVLDQMTVDVAAKGYTFRASGSLIKFPGFTKLYEETAEDNGAAEESNQPLPDVREGEALAARELKPEQHFTKPPPRYTEAMLIRALEENGIGRPSTYAPTINVIQERGYVEREKNRLKPTQLGEDVNVLLVANFPDILNINFTARMEEDLDLVEEGQQEWHGLLKEFYAGFEKDLEAAQKRFVSDVIDGDSNCPECGSPFEVREGRFGLFIACQRYPECKTTRKISKPSAVQPTDEVCEKCGAPMVIREGRFGRFMSCSTYPKCKNTHTVDKEGNKQERPPKEPPRKTDQVCPDCGAFLLVRKNRMGEEFLGCEKYPKCKFAKPMDLNLKCVRPGCEGSLVTKRGRGRRFIGCDKYPECDLIVFGQLDTKTPCPKCNNSWTTIVKQREKPPTRKCPVPTCDYQEELPEDA